MCVPIIIELPALMYMYTNGQYCIFNKGVGVSSVADLEGFQGVSIETPFVSDRSIIVLCLSMDYERLHVHSM